MTSDGRPPMLGLTVAVIAYAVAMSYLEAAVVVYLRAAIGLATGDVFPVDFSESRNLLGFIELGREAATLVMIGAVGWIAGRSPLERLAWAAVVFGVWDIGYYAWLWVFSGWPSSIDTWDLLFLLPLPWAGPVWAPVAVSAALIGFGLAYARQLRGMTTVQMTRADLGVLVLGGLVVVVSFVLNAGLIIAGDVPTQFAWPVFGAGMALGIGAAWHALQPRWGWWLPR